MKLLVINPNTSEAMTKDIWETVERVKHPETSIAVVSPDFGPEGLESFYDYTLSAFGLCRLLQKEKEMLLNDGLTRYSNMKTTLMAALGDPAATSFLSMQPDELFERLQKEMKQLETTSALTTMQKKIVNFVEVA